jgi:FkbM family methyltransferase
MIKDLIYDVGMHNGDDTAYYLHRGFRVLAIEADPTLCSKASIQFKEEIDRGQLTVLNIGITPEPGLLDFWVCETTSVWNSFDRRSASRDNSPHHSIQVSCQTFDWVLKNYGTPYYLKVDIEGYDHLCIEALPIGGDLPKYISVELGEIDSFVERFEALGYTGYKCISQYNFLPLQLPPAKEMLNFERWHRLLMSRNLVARVICKTLGRERLWNSILQSRRQGNWTFQEGSSGPFGEDTPGRWVNSKEICDTYRHYSHLFEEQRAAPFWIGKDYWVDLHARIAG